MIIYFLLFIFCYFFSFVKYSKLIGIFCFFIIALILCFGYMTGSDWRSYELIYYHKLGYNKEPLYLMLNNIFSYLGVNFWVYFIFLKIILLIIFFYSYKELDVPLIFCIMLFIISPGLYLFIDNPMRSLIAYAIFTYSTKYIVSKNFIKYFLCIMIAAGFHLTVIVVAPIYFLYKINIKNWIIIMLFILINIIFISQNTIFNTIKFLIKPFPDISSRIMTYINLSLTNPNLGDFKSNIITIGFFIRILGLIALLYYKNKIIAKFKYGKLVILFSFFYLLLSRITMSFALFSRITIFFEIFYICAIGYILKLLPNQIKLIVSLSIFIYSSLYAYRVITSDFRYVPYTNYLVSIIKNENLSYEERSKYNFIKSPYNIKGTEYLIEY